MPTTSPPANPVQAPVPLPIMAPSRLGKTGDPCPEMDAGWYVRATINAARLHALRIQHAQLVWISDHYPLSGARKARHTRAIDRSDALLRDLAGQLITGGCQ